MKVIPNEGSGWMVMTNTANRSANKVVIAAGAWSLQLLRPLGIKLPFETERGYHAMLFNPEVVPAPPISNRTRAFGMTPMEDGLRVAGTVEIAGRDASSMSSGRRYWSSMQANVPRAQRQVCALLDGVPPAHAGQLADPGRGMPPAGPALRVRPRPFRP